MSLASVVSDFEKDQDTNENQLAAGLLTKENLSLKTEIPFSYDVEVTALVKDVFILMGELFNDMTVHSVERNEDKSIKLDIDGNTIPIMIPKVFQKKTETGIIVDIPFGEAIANRLINSINLSEEYAVSHKRKGRLEVAAVLARKFLSHDRYHPENQDSLAKLVNR